ncbi:serine/arginine repetitive matrix protein 1-like isoform X1 [Anneissia japonica]|uniref:serine/arginine repetitive matrix protein 1-like isoform X1 n=1 Tax=Anneissia japonica TaxID=1529436 RepID=UPI001425B30A|nr:serine/arginine repetitive matrix protein 1-like isoform X1 [Anneissia japonica]XP_033113810.1 serine/arginine repetitive matrix protein 1-like isoform X1 [Anneissia japonica]
MGIMCCCYVKKNDDYESLNHKSSVESPSGHSRYGTVDDEEHDKIVSARPPETKQGHYPKSPLKQKISLQSSDSEQRSVRHVRIHVSSSDSDESDDDSPPPIHRSAYSSAPPKIHSGNSAPATKEHAPVKASPSITIEGDEEEKDQTPKTIASGLAAILKGEDIVSPPTEATRADGEGASAESSDPEDSTGGHSSISANQAGSLDSLDDSDKGKKSKKSKSVVRKVGTSMKRASRKASKSMQKGMAKMLHPNKGKDSPNDSEDHNNRQYKSSIDDDLDNQDEPSLTVPSTNLPSPGPPTGSPRSPRPISPGGHSPVSPARHRSLSYGRRSPSSPSAHQPLTRMSSDRMHSKYAREKVLEREKQWGKIEAEAQNKQDSQKTSAIGQALQAANERGQRLKEVEETTGIMHDSAFNFAESAKHLKEKKKRSAKYTSH